MFDSLNQRMLPPYGCDWVHAPNFERLAAHSVTFDNAFVGSMPCMPARRDLHTGRYNFLHRGWGPLEPFDLSMPEVLKNRGVYTHLATDHQHYFEDGGATYHTRYSSWEFMRGQEGDPWKGHVSDPNMPPTLGLQSELQRQDWINRQYLTREANYPQAQTFAAGLAFIRQNAKDDNWFLQIETFDPHEPFVVPKAYSDLYPHEYDGPIFDWPKYGVVDERQDEVAHCRFTYAALLSMCDQYLGQVLDLMDECELWQDTMLIVTTDHGYFLGEKGWWAKMVQPFYNEVARIPFFAWDPRAQCMGERRKQIVQLIDVPATLYDLFEVPTPSTVEGVSLGAAIAENGPTRETALYGMFGGHVNITDGRYCYMRAPPAENKPLYEYTLMPTRMRQRFAVSELQNATLAEPFSFSKGCPLLKTEGKALINPYLYGTLLFDLENDDAQEHPLQDDLLESRMIHLLLEQLQRQDTPHEQFERLGLPTDGKLESIHYRAGELRDKSTDRVGQTNVVWRGSAKSIYYAFLDALPTGFQRQLELGIEGRLQEGQSEIDDQTLISWVKSLMPQSLARSLEALLEIASVKGRA